MKHKALATCLAILMTTGSAIAQDNAFQLKPGDLLFQQTDCGPFCEAINKVTEGVNGIDFSHVGILIKNDSGQWVVLEAVSAGVKETPLKEFLNRSVDQQGLPKVAVGRMKKTSETRVDDILRNKDQYLGKKYDKVFDIENDTYYCSELVYFLYKNKNGKPLFDLFPMTFTDPETGNTFEIWENYYEKLNHKIPEGKPGLNPGGISRSEKLAVFFPYSEF